MSILSTLERIAHQYREHRNRVQTERAIAQLSPDIRKDIGWPDARSDSVRVRPRSSVSRWA